MTAINLNDDNYNSSDDSTSDWSDSNYTPKKRPTRKTKKSSTTPSLSKTNSGKQIKKPKKPGRKPLESFDELPSDPKLKRKVQNRAAQRAFRERKEQYLNELQEQMKELKLIKEKREKELLKDINMLKKENEKLQQEIQTLKSDKLNPNTTIVSPPVTHSSPDQNRYYGSSGSDLSDYQGNSPMTDSLSIHHSDNSVYDNHQLDTIFGTDISLLNYNSESLDPFYQEQVQTLTEDDNSKKKLLYFLNLKQLNNTDELNNKILFDKNFIMNEEDVDFIY